MATSTANDNGKVFSLRSKGTPSTSSNIGSQGSRTILEVLPRKQLNINEAPKCEVFTYFAKLDFTKASRVKSSGGFTVNVADCLRKWIMHSRLLTSSFLLHPYDEGVDGTSGQPISHEDQLPSDDLSAYTTYYHNHRATQKGFLTGMVKFSCNLPWGTIKERRKPYFNWMESEGIYLAKTNFQSDSISTVGWIFGAHPDSARRDDSYKELKERLNLDPGINFQISTRPMSVAVKKGSTIKISFKALVIETDGKNVAKVREAFFGLGDPATELPLWPITGYFLFVPLYETKSWTQEKIAQLAKVHVMETNKLRSIFIENLKDIDKPLPSGNAFCTIRMGLNQVTEQGLPLYHSIHKTNRPNVIAILVTQANLEAAEARLSNLHSEMEASIPHDLRSEVFFADAPLQITGRIVDSHFSKLSSGIADRILSSRNPQEDMDTDRLKAPPPKVPRTQLSYAEATKPDVSDADQPSTADSLFDRLLERMKEQFGELRPVRHEDMDKKVQEGVAKRLAEFQTQVDIKLTQMSVQVNDFQGQVEQRLTEMSSQVKGASAEIGEKFTQVIGHQNDILVNIVTQVQSSLLTMQQNMVRLQNGERIDTTFTSITLLPTTSENAQDAGPAPRK